MIKNLIQLLFIVLIYSCSSSNSSDKEINILIKIEGSDNSGEVRLQKVNSDYSIELIKSGNFIDNEIEFDVYNDESALYRIDILGKRSVDVILKDRDIKILIDDKNSSFTTKILDSPDTDVLIGIGDKISTYRSEIRELNMAFIDANNEKDIQKINSIREEVSFKRNQFELSLKNYLDNVDNSLAVLVTAGYLPIGENISFWEKIYERYLPEFENNSYFKKFESDLIKLKAVSVGSIAPEIILNDTTGNPVSLSSFRGKYVLLDFWAAWCRPCREENPNILKNYEIFKDRGFEVFQVSLDRSRKDWVRGIKQDMLPWVNVSDLRYYQSEAAQLYNINKIPSAFLLDPSGEIIAKDTQLRGVNLYNKLQEVFN
tara:strand:- start:369 stop:1484 length:1116 start_codon:yes stop_codon:yes gene_type:complete